MRGIRDYAIWCCGKTRPLSIYRGGSRSVQPGKSAPGYLPQRVDKDGRFVLVGRGLMLWLNGVILARLLTSWWGSWKGPALYQKTKSSTMFWKSVLSKKTRFWSTCKMPNISNVTKTDVTWFPKICPIIKRGLWPRLWLCGFLLVVFSVMTNSLEDGYNFQPDRKLSWPGLVLISKPCLLRSFFLPFVLVYALWESYWLLFANDHA